MDRNAGLAECSGEPATPGGDDDLLETEPAELTGEEKDLSLPTAPLAPGRDVNDAREPATHFPSESGKSGQPGSWKGAGVARRPINGISEVPRFTVPITGAPGMGGPS